jgi:hypothetical protein
MTADMLISEGDPSPRSGVDRTMQEGIPSAQPRPAACSRVRLLAVAVALLALLATACSGGSHPARPRASSAPDLAAMQAYARCLRAHGLPRVHVTSASGISNLNTVLIFNGLAVQGAPAGSPQVRTAVDACHHLIPQSMG